MTNQQQPKKPAFSKLRDFFSRNSPRRGHGAKPMQIVPFSVQLVALTGKL